MLILDITSWHNVQMLLLIFILVVFFLMAIQDIFFNKKSTIRHNFPLVGRLRYLLEKIGPELRQYIVASNREELPFNRSQRSWVYSSSKRQNNYESFGTDKDIFGTGHIFLKPSMFPFSIKVGHPNYFMKDFLPCAKIMGLYNGRKKPFRPYSVVNISAMSFGSLSSNAITALNKGALKAGCFHNTGEGSMSPYHSFGADVILQIGTGYFGVRDLDGNFSFEKLEKLIAKNPTIKAIEIKLSQGAKPGKGGVLPAAKISKEIAEIRGVPIGKDIISPPNHSAFANLPELMIFIEKIAEKTGLPVGIKSAVGQMNEWHELADLMIKENKGPDFITIDGGEGGTGAAPPSFADHVSIPFVYAFKNVYKIFLEKGLTERIVFIASGKLGFPANALMAFAMGADLINVAREAMMAIGCIQAQKCHTNNCPTGIATQNRWFRAGLDPTLKSERYYNYVKTLRKEMLEITHACGYEHPCQMTMEDVELSAGNNNQNNSLKIIFDYDKLTVPFENMKALSECSYLGGLKSKELQMAGT
jgi:glutamate synthase domain-containing protein 2